MSSVSPVLTSRLQMDLLLLCRGQTFPREARPGAATWSQAAAAAAEPSVEHPKLPPCSFFQRLKWEVIAHIQKVLHGVQSILFTLGM